jgi:hypothetical protein
MGYSQSKANLDLCFNVLVRPTHARVFRRANQLRGRKQGRVVPFGGARQGPTDRR